MGKISKTKARKPPKAPKLGKKMKKPLKKTASKKKHDFSTMSVDNFLDEVVLENDSEHSDVETTEDIDVNGAVENPSSDSEADSVNGDSEDEVEKHKNALARLQKTDPEFYKFLQENDKKLLQFNLSDEDEEESDQENDTEDAILHKPPRELEVASDESDYEVGEEEQSGEIKDSGVINLKMLKQWEIDIQKDTSNKTITVLTQAFHACLTRVSSEEHSTETPSQFIVEGSAVFNGVIQLCVLQLGPALRRFLGLKPGSKQAPHKSKKFVKVKNLLKGYFQDLTQLLHSVSSANIQTVLLKHLHYLSSFLVSYTNIAKSILKRLIHIWGSGDEGVRVLAFFCILRITNSQKATFLSTVLKSMYMTYVRNSKFVSTSSLSAINFMRRSLVEMFALDVPTSYQHVFLYIRQLAIHLRNAITVHKKENIQAVYNWQFINCLKLWGHLLGVTGHKPQLQQLLYPFVQVCLGVIKLNPTAQYYPLRFHVVKILMDLGASTGTFIPILPFILEVLTGFDFNKKHLKASMKPVQFTCILRVSKSQMSENGFKDAIIETIYGLLLEYLSAQSSSLTFPDLSLIASLQMKEFMKKCNNANYNRKMKQILEKIDQNNDFIDAERSKLTINITDFKQFDGMESQIKTKGTPISTFFENWKKVHSLKKNKQFTNNEELGDYKLPVLKKKTILKQTSSKSGPVELFPSDSESEEEEDAEEEKPRRGKRGGRNKSKKFTDESGPVDAGDGEDFVEDLKISDW